jgi:nucleotide-binding universal stress UspA family protein
MLTIIVPLDFSQSSFNAALYAANMYKDRADVRLILYHFYQHGEDTANAENFLSSQKAELSSFVNTIETELESGHSFIDSLAAYAHVKGAYMIVMGLTGKTPMAQRFSGTNTLRMTEKEVCPVLIVPEDAVYKSLSNAMITSELKYVEESPTLLSVKRVLQTFRPSLHILNVNSQHYISLTEDYREETDKMGELLAEFNPEFHFLELYDFHESVDAFTNDNNIDLIIISPKYHVLYERLFKTLHTKKLIYHTRVPVLTVHE